MLNELCKVALIEMLKEMENLQMFSLSNGLDYLYNKEDDKTIDNENTIDTTIENTNDTTIEYTNDPISVKWTSFLKESCRASFWIPPIVAQLKAPPLFGYTPFPPARMGLIYRFLPGHSSFLFNEFHFNECLIDRFQSLSHSLGLSLKKKKSILSLDLLFHHSHSGAGLKGLISDFEDLTNIFVEVASYYKGWCCRFFIMVSLGIGCIIWFKCVPCISGQTPHALFVGPMTHEPFLNLNYQGPEGFHKFVFMEESQNISAFVDSALADEISIPATGKVLTAVGLGVMLAFFLTLGQVPCAEMNVN